MKVYFEISSAKEITSEEHRRLMLCYPRRYRYAYFNKWLKEVKMRPYLEVKVVKVKKEKKYFTTQKFEGRLYGFYYDKNSEVHIEKIKKNIKEEKKGNWVNGENLDKIKFPCFCSYSDGEGSERKKGFLSMNNGYYHIANINSQKKIQNDVTDPCCNLKEFITKHNIHILKGKIIIFEEK